LLFSNSIPNLRVFRLNPFPVASIKESEQQTQRFAHSSLEAAMKQNIGNSDRVIRVLLAIAVGVLYFTNQISGMAALLLGFFAVIFLLTSTMAFCPIYVPFKISTKKEAA
jgi:hypothetical protein